MTRRFVFTVLVVLALGVTGCKPPHPPPVPGPVQPPSPPGTTMPDVQSKEIGLSEISK